MTASNDLKRLNDKLSQYVQKVRQLGGSSKDTPAFLASLSLVEDELRKLKALYEAEIDDLRQKLSAANKAKNDSQSEVEKLRHVSADLNDKYKTETAKNEGLLSDIQRHKEKIADLEQQLAKTKASMQGPSTQLADAKKELSQLAAQNDAMRNELGQEKSRSKQLQDTINDVQKKVSFNEQVNKERLEESEKRNERSKAKVTELDKKIKDLEKQVTTAPEILAKLRANADAEIKKFKDESEAEFKKNIANLKKQMDAQAANGEQLRAANRDLQATNDDLRNKLTAQEGAIRELKAQIAATEEQLAAERTRGAEQIRGLEKKLQELQDSLYKQMQDMNANREQQATLRTEIDNYRAILEEEERRLGGYSSKTPGSNAGSPTQSRSGSCYGNKNSTGSTGGNRNAVGAGGGSKGQTGQAGTDTGARYATPPYTMRTEYQFSYARPGYNYMSYTKSGPNPGMRRMSTSADGFPTLDSTCKGGFTTGSTNMYMTRSPDIRGNGTYANTNNGQIRQAGLPAVV